jgi:hypothetical protein
LRYASCPNTFERRLAREARHTLWPRIRLASVKRRGEVMGIGS